MKTTAFERFAGVCAILAGIAGFLYSLAFIVIARSVPNVPQTLEGARMLHQGNLAVFPDLQTRTADLFAEGDMVVERWTMTCHHTGAPFFVGNLPASGRKIDVGGINSYLIKDGKIVETWANMDFMGVLQQIGLMPGA